MNLKYHYPVFVFVLAFAAVAYFSFKHERAPDSADRIAASAQERQDQISLSAMHAEPAPLSTSSVVHPTPADFQQLHVLEQVLASKNDNDPRLDKDLRALTPAAKSLMRGRYGTTAPEKRNQRGTIVFLVGRELSSADDVNFLHSVLNEPPCLSLSNCSNEDKASMASDDHHHDGMNEVTLAYPQLVALKSIEAYLNQPGTTELTAALAAELDAARRSPVRKVASMADDIARQYHAKHP